MNSNATHRIVMDKRRPIKDGRFPVKLRVTYRRRSRYYKTRFYLSEEDFRKAYLNNNQPRDITLRNIRTKLRYIESQVEDALLDLDDFSFKSFEELYLKAEQEDDITKDLDYYYSQIIGDKMLSLSSRETAANSRNALQKGLGLSSFKGVDLATITVEKLKVAQQNLSNQGLSDTTISIYMRTLRKIYNMAMKDGVISQEEYPFGRSKFIPPNVKRRKTPLTRVELKKLLDSNANGNKYIQEAKDFFLLSLYLEGVNMADILHLRNSDVSSGYARFYRRKTKYRVDSMEEHATLIVPHAAEIMDRYRQREDLRDEAYVFWVLHSKMSEDEMRNAVKNFTRKVNQHLKKLSDMCDIQTKLTTVVARHTWASHASILLGLEETRRRIGHKDIKSTEHYIGSLVGSEEYIDFHKLVQEQE